MSGVCFFRFFCFFSIISQTCVKKYDFFLLCARILESVPNVLRFCFLFFFVFLKQALATVAGIIDGTGSFGAAITQYLVAVLSNYGWDLVFVVLTILLLASSLLMLKLFINEMKLILRYGRRTSEEIESGFGIGGYGDIEGSDIGQYYDDENRNICCICLSNCCNRNGSYNHHRSIRVQHQSFSDFGQLHS